MAKKLRDDFDRVASENGRDDASDTGNKGKKKGSPTKDSGSDGRPESMATRTRGRRFKKCGDAEVVMRLAEEVVQSNPKGKKTKAEKSKSKGDKCPVSANGVRTSPRLARGGGPLDFM